MKVTIADITNQVLLALDQKVGRPQSPTTKRIFAACWSLAILTGICVFFYMLFIGGDSANPAGRKMLHRSGTKSVLALRFGLFDGLSVIVFIICFLFTFKLS